MFEKVNPAHPDKIADRIAGAIVDLAYKIAKDPKIAVEVMIGHGQCFVIIESSVEVNEYDIKKAVWRIAGSGIATYISYNKQDSLLAQNQESGIRCGDNGIFRGMPVTPEQKYLTKIAQDIYGDCPYDGKYIIYYDRLIICQSHLPKDYILDEYGNCEVNPLGDWTGGLDVDTGATNRKLGSDMGDSVTGGGLHGKDLSKADVSINIFAWLMAKRLNEPIELSCAIGDDTVHGIPYAEIVETARDYINNIGGFEAFAEWGLIR